MARGFAEMRSVLVVPLEPLRSAPCWLPGPLPLTLPDGSTATAAARSAYFEDRAASVLYGRRPRVQRLHQAELELRGPVLGTLVTGVELLVTGELAHLLLHVSLDGQDGLDHLSDLVRIKDVSAPLRQWVPSLLGRSLIPAADCGRAISVTYAEPTMDGYPASNGQAFGVDDESGWLWALAAATPHRQYPPHPAAAARLLRQRVYLSMDWTALVLRDGVGFLATRCRRDEHDFLSLASVYARSIYTDVVLLGVLQHTELSDIADTLAALDPPTEDLERLLELEARLSRFRSAYWWQHVTDHGPANELLLALHEQRRLPALLEQIVGDLGAFSQQALLAAQRRSEYAQQRTNALLTVLAILGIPLALASALTDLLPGEARWSSPVAAASAIIVLVVLILIRGARPPRRRRVR